MKCMFSVRRSDTWVAAQRLATAENVHDETTVEIEVGQLSEASRRILLSAFCGQYPSQWRGYFGQDYQFSVYASYGRLLPAVDAVAPTVQQIDAALQASVTQLAAERAEHERGKAEREAQRAKEQAEKQAREQALTAARELLADDLKRGEQYYSDRRILADFLAAIPDDALRGTLKALAHSQEAIETLRQTVEDASPVTIFADDDESDV